MHARGPSDRTGSTLTELHLNAHADVAALHPLLPNFPTRTHAPFTRLVAACAGVTWGCSGCMLRAGLAGASGVKGFPADSFEYGFKAAIVDGNKYYDMDTTDSSYGYNYDSGVLMEISRGMKAIEVALDGAYNDITGTWGQWACAGCVHCMYAHV